MKAWDQLTPPESRKMQDSLLRRFITKQVYPFSSHYRNLMDAKGIDPESIRSVDDLRRLPFTSKNDLLNSPEHPERAKEFLLLPDPAVLRRRPSILLKALTRGREWVRRDLEDEYQPLLLEVCSGGPKSQGRG